MEYNSFIFIFKGMILNNNFNGFECVIEINEKS